MRNARDIVGVLVIDGDAAEAGLAHEMCIRDRHYTVGEEIMNSVTHGVGCLLGIAGLVLLIVFAALRGGDVYKRQAEEREQWSALERLQSVDGALLSAAQDADDELDDAADAAQTAADAATRCV